MQERWRLRCSEFVAEQVITGRKWRPGINRHSVSCDPSVIASVTIGNYPQDIRCDDWVCFDEHGAAFEVLSDAELRAKAVCLED